RPVGALADPELSLEDVPDLGEVVLVERMVRAGLVADEARGWLGRPVGRGMEQHLAPLPGPAQRLPLPIVGVHRLHWLMHEVPFHRFAVTPASSVVRQSATHASRRPGAMTSSAPRGV